MKSSEIDFIPVFKAFQDLIDNKNLPESVRDFKHGSDTFQIKIDEIQAYISRITDEDHVVKFLKRNAANDVICGGILTKCWRDVFQISKLSQQHLLQSFDRCVNRTQRACKEEFIEPSRVAERPEINITALNESFEDSVNRFYGKIEGFLPITLEDVLINEDLDDTAYERFIFCLHLIQKKTLNYIKKTKMLMKYE